MFPIILNQLKTKTRTQLVLINLPSLNRKVAVARMKKKLLFNQHTKILQKATFCREDHGRHNKPVTSLSRRSTGVRLGIILMGQVETMARLEQAIKILLLVV
jgi:hypothetical protein